MIGKEISKALAHFQRIAPTIKKDAVNPHFRSRYADLESILSAIHAPMEQAGIGFVQFPEFVRLHDTPQAPCLKMVITHFESGDQIEGVLPLKLSKDDAQSMGSAITYARRYLIVTMLGLNVSDDDDDGESASPKLAEKAKAEKKPQPAPLHPVLKAMGKNVDQMKKAGADQDEAVEAVRVKVKEYLKGYQVEYKSAADITKIQGDTLAAIVADIEAAQAENTWPWAGN